ncbi:MAG TPA: LysR family transcriptional regulator [Candidatus Competibacteraceae bacterium]|nr:LysR family transcriptional regulator [Candidatus Competibacteraceae bacterium]
MDINLLKTFLEVQRTGHFGRAAENLFLTQSAVSARIRLLEQQLEVTLFERGRRALRLTPAGWRFLPHAERLLQVWQEACRDTGRSALATESLGLGLTPNLLRAGVADGLLRRLREERQLALQVEAGEPQSLVRRLLQMELDLVLLLDPPALAGVQVRTLTPLELRLVSERPRPWSALVEDYIAIDWGMGVCAHCLRLGLTPGRLRLGPLELALRWLEEQGGAAYLPTALAEEGVQNRGWVYADQAPVLRVPVCALFSHNNPRRERLESLLSAPAVPARAGAAADAQSLTSSSGSSESS